MLTKRNISLSLILVLFAGLFGSPALARRGGGHHGSGSHHGGSHYGSYGHHGYGHHRSHYFYYSTPFYWDYYPRSYYYYSPYRYRDPWYGRPTPRYRRRDSGYRQPQYRQRDSSYKQQDDSRYNQANRFADVREKIKRQKSEKQARQTRLDRNLEEITEVFAAGDYAETARRAAKALTAEPDDSVLAFVYAQSLFANATYGKAADVLRKVLGTIDVDSQGVFFPLVFYPERDVLAKQINKLAEAAKSQPSNADLQLLYGYQLLGLNSFDEAQQALQKARLDYVNSQAASLLLRVLDQMRETGA